MAAFIPNRKDAEVNDAALAAVRADKTREADDGFDGSWVAHPDLVPVALEVFDAKLGDRPNQLDRLREDVSVTAAQLLDAKATPGEVTEAGVRNNVSVGIQYLESWLRGGGAVAIFNLMEDAATAEISRSQIWQWVHNGVKTAEGTAITPEWVRQVEDEELAKVRAVVGDEKFTGGKYAEARELFEQVALADDFVEFLTLPAYERLA
jgi:malate synthase